LKHAFKLALITAGLRQQVRNDQNLSVKERMIGQETDHQYKRKVSVGWE